MNERSIVVIGAGGHAKVVIATAQAVGRHVSAVFDDDAQRHGSTILGVPIVGDLTAAPPRSPAVIAIGDNAARARVARKLDLAWEPLVHPRAYVHATAAIAPGAVVFAGAIVQPGTIVGAHAIVNTSASIDHDCHIGDVCHIAPGAHLAGNVRVGEGAFVGIGSSITLGLSIGEWSMVGAGAAVIHDIPARRVAVGVPARVIKEIP